MLGFFTDFYEDELVFSAYARFLARRGIKPTKGNLDDMVGSRRISLRCDLPEALDELVSRLPTGHLYSPEILLNKNTLFPLYRPFIPVTDVKRYEHLICYRDKPGITLYHDSRTAKYPYHPHTLRYCPRCAQEDRNKNGECYWRRLHQAPGVWICPKHQVWLEEARVSPINQPTEYVLATLEEVADVERVRPVEESNQMHKLLLEIAVDTEWLLNQPNINLAKDGLQARYIVFLQGLSLVSGARNVLKLDILNERVSSYYGQPLLHFLRCAAKIQPSFPPKNKYSRNIHG